ncbi:MAG: MobA/MobL family protein [Lachnospiraceae bacterium]|nr:MobA/MobL family protein [Lachnospiraceae bacterium]
MSALEHSAYITASSRCMDEVMMHSYSRSATHTASLPIIIDYSNKNGVIYTKMYLPENAPVEFKNNPEKLWNSVDAIEKNVNSQLYREMIFSFDNCLTNVQIIKICKKFASALAKEGMAVEFAIHCPNQNRKNIHVHIMMTLRGFKEDGTWENKQKSRPNKLDANGNRIPVIDPLTGKQKKKKGGGLVWERMPAECLHNWNSIEWWDSKRDYMTDMVNDVLEAENKMYRRNNVCLKEKGKESRKVKYPYVLKKDEITFPFVEEPKVGKTATVVYKRVIEAIESDKEKMDTTFEHLLEYLNNRYCDAAVQQRHNNELIDDVVLSDELKNLCSYAGKDFVKEGILKNKKWKKENVAKKIVNYYKEAKYFEEEYEEQRRYAHCLKYKELANQWKRDILVLACYGMTPMIQRHIISYENEIMYRKSRMFESRRAFLMKIKEKAIHKEAEERLSNIDQKTTMQEHFDSLAKEMHSDIAEGINNVESKAIDDKRKIISDKQVLEETHSDRLRTRIVPKKKKRSNYDDVIAKAMEEESRAENNLDMIYSSIYTGNKNSKIEIEKFEELSENEYMEQELIEADYYDDDYER